MPPQKLGGDFMRGIPSLRKQYVGDIDTIIMKKISEMNTQFEKKFAEAIDKGAIREILISTTGQQK